MSMRVFIVVAALIIPVMLFGVSCQKEMPASKKLAFEPSLQDSMSEQRLYAEFAEDEDGTAYESEEEEGEDQDAGYESEEEEGEDQDAGYEPEEEKSDDTGYEPEEDGEDEEPIHESDTDEQA
jgi:hypothetical protein